MLLYINACARENSRTDELARELLSLIGEPYVERKLSEEDLAPLSGQSLANRTEQLAVGNYDHPMFARSREFAGADTIVISAPYWDLSFPAVLKEYIENIYAIGIVSRYRADGTTEGLCRAQRLYYVTTAGGPYRPQYSFEYIKELCLQSFGIKNVFLIKAEMLDIAGSDPSAIMRGAKRRVRREYGAMSGTAAQVKGNM